METLRDKWQLRRAAQWVLAGLGVALLGVGLALLSGVMQTQPPSASTALVMMHPLPHAGSSPSARPPAPHRAAVMITGKAADSGALPAPKTAPRRSRLGPGDDRGVPQDPRVRGGRAAARLAIVIDDIGHNVDATRRFLGLGYPLTFSVLPDVAHSRESAQLIRQAGREYIIHLPMEPFGYPAQNPGPYPLLLSQGMEETARRVRGYLEVLPEATGASNHMGSAYTYDEDHMRVVQTVLADRDLFFLNSRTSGTPVPGRVARQWGYGYLERDVFLDHDLSERAIERAFRAAARQALRAGQAIAIGHPHPQTWRVLHRGLPWLAENGVRVVTLSDLRGRNNPGR